MEKVEELKEKIEKWQEELETVWAGKETDAAEVERRNLRNLIANAKREIEEIENPKTQNELGNSFDALKEEYNNMKKEDADKKLQINRLKMRIDKLTDERENYASLKNSSYKDIYDEYTKQIEEAEKEIKELEEEPQAGKDKKLRTITALRMEYEKQIKEKQKEIRAVQREIEDIEFGTEEAMVEKELSDGTKVKTPKILDLYKKKDELEKALKELETNKEECQAYIDQIKGIEEREEPRELSAEEIKYFHGQGDVVENTRDDRRANDEYFGFEKVAPGMRKEPGGEPVKDPEPPKASPAPKTGTTPTNPGQTTKNGKSATNSKSNSNSNSNKNNQLIKRENSIWQKLKDWNNSRKTYKIMLKSIKNMPENAYEYDGELNPYEIRKSIQGSLTLSDKHKEKLSELITNKYPTYMKYREDIDDLFNKKENKEESKKEINKKNKFKESLKVNIKTINQFKKSLKSKARSLGYSVKEGFKNGRQKAQEKAEELRNRRLERKDPAYGYYMSTEQAKEQNTNDVLSLDEK